MAGGLDRAGEIGGLTSSQQANLIERQPANLADDRPAGLSELTNNHTKRGQENNHIRTQEARNTTQDTGLTCVLCGPAPLL